MNMEEIRHWAKVFQVQVSTFHRWLSNSDRFGRWAIMGILTIQIGQHL